MAPLLLPLGAPPKQGAGGFTIAAKKKTATAQPPLRVRCASLLLCVRAAFEQKATRPHRQPSKSFARFCSATYSRKLFFVMLSPWESIFAIMMEQSTSVDLLKDYSPIIWEVYTALVRSGGRISEILGIRHTDEISAGVYIVHGLKKSRSYTVEIPGHLYLKSLCFDCSIHLFGTLHRCTVHRALVKFGLYAQLNNNNNMTVCHLPRHKLAAALFNSSQDPKLIQDLLKHNSIKSQTHYEPKKRTRKY